MSVRQRDLIARRLDHLRRMRRHLDYSARRMREGDIADQSPRRLTDEQGEILAAFRTRFSEYQEQLGKLLKAVAIEEGVAIVGITDVLAFAEKAGIVDSSEDWKEPRDIRNAVAHEYEENEQLLAELIVRMLDLVEMLESIHERSERYCVDKYAVPPAQTSQEKQ